MLKTKPATRQESRYEDGNVLPCRKNRCGEPLRDDGTCWACDHPVECASNQPTGKDSDCDCGDEAIRRAYPVAPAPAKEVP